MCSCVFLPSLPGCRLTHGRLREFSVQAEMKGDEDQDRFSGHAHPVSAMEQVGTQNATNLAAL